MNEISVRRLADTLQHAGSGATEISCFGSKEATNEARTKLVSNLSCPFSPPQSAPRRLSTGRQRGGGNGVVTFSSHSAGHRRSSLVRYVLTHAH